MQMKLKYAILLSAAFLMTFGAEAKKKSGSNTNTVGYTYLESNFQTYDAIQKQIHCYAEPGYQEYKSSEALAKQLEDNGFTVERGVAGIPTAFVATFGSGKPVIGLLGEYDALLGMSQDTVAFKKARVDGAPGHACGHNLLGTATCAAAVAISKWLAEGHVGTVKFFGCPAEEGGGGKVYMTREGVFNGCDAMFDWHPGTDNSVSLDPWLANVRIKFTFHGKAAHASAAPWDGRSALDAVEAFNHMMNLMREHVTPDTRIHYVITDGGKLPNVVPDRAQVDYYLRSSKASEVFSLAERAVKAAEGAAMGTGTTMEYELLNGCYEKLINRRLSEILLANLKQVGGLRFDGRERTYLTELRRASGEIEPGDLSRMETIVSELVPPSGGGASTDVGDVSQLVPTCSLTIAATPCANIHTWQMAATAGSTAGTKALLTVAKTFYLTALDLYGSPSDIHAIWDEYYKVQGHDFKYIPPVGNRLPPFDYCK